MTSRRCPDGQCLSALEIDRYLGDGRLDELAAHSRVTSCERCAARAAAQRAAYERFAAAPPPLSLPEAATSRGRTRRGPVQRWAPATGIFALAAAVVLWWRAQPSPRDDEAATRSKGAGSLSMYLRRGERTWLAEDGEMVQPGDQVRFAYACPRSCYVTVVATDATRAAWVVVGAEAAGERVEGGSEALSPIAVELDDKPGDTFHGVFCDAPISLAPWVAELRSTAEPPPPPAGCMLRTMRLRKARAP